MLTKEAWNAFLKTLEEPPPNTVFVLATTEPHKVMPTIVDRCQRFDFQRPSLEQISEVAAPGRRRRGDRDRRRRGGDDRPLGLRQLPRRARHPRPAGRLRRRRRSRPTTCSSCSAPPTPSCSSTPPTRSPPATPRAALEAVERLARSGRDPAQFARDLLAHLRQLLVDPDDRRGPRLLRGHRRRPERLAAQAEAIGDANAGPARSTSSQRRCRRRSARATTPRLTARGRAAEGCATPSLDPSTRGSACAGSSARRLALRRRRGRRRRPRRPRRRRLPTPARQPAGQPSRTDAARGRTARGAEPPPSLRGSRAATATVEIERVVELWPAVLDQLRRLRRPAMLSTLFDEARPVGDRSRSGRCSTDRLSGLGDSSTSARPRRRRTCERMAEAVGAIAGDAAAARLRAARRTRARPPIRGTGRDRARRS